MKRFYFISVLLIISLPALAQQPPDAATLQLQIDETQYLLTERRAQVVAITKQLRQLQEYLKACKDKPGCTVPVESQETPK